MTPKPRKTARQLLVEGLILFAVAYGVQLLNILLRVLVLDLLALIFFGLSFLYLIRSVIARVRRKQNPD